MEIIAGTTRGSANSKGSNKNQDSYYLGWNEGVLTGFVSDGCGSAPNSELGATVSVIEAVKTSLLLGRSLTISPNKWLPHLQIAVKKALSKLEELVGDPDPTIATLLGFVIFEEEYVIISCGDGSYEVNGEWHHLEYANNAPPYLAQGHSLKLLSWGATQDLKSLTIATDGVDYWREDLDLPGGKVSIPLANLLADRKIYKNPAALQRYLNLLNRDLRDDGMLLHGPTLADDTAIISLRSPDESPGPERHELFPGIVLGKRWGG